MTPEGIALGMLVIGVLACTIEGIAHVILRKDESTCFSGKD